MLRPFLQRLMSNRPTAHPEKFALVNARSLGETTDARAVYFFASLAGLQVHSAFAEDARVSMPCCSRCRSPSRRVTVMRRACLSVNTICQADGHGMRRSASDGIHAPDELKQLPALEQKIRSKYVPRGR